MNLQPSGGLGRGPAHFGPAWAGFLTAHQGPVAHFGPNLTENHASRENEKRSFLQVSNKNEVLRKTGIFTVKCNVYDSLHSFK